MKIQQPGRDFIVVASDIRDDRRRAAFAQFLEKDLHAVRMTESVYEFAFGGAGRRMQKIVDELDALIDGRTDAVVIWDIDDGGAPRRILLGKAAAPRHLLLISSSRASRPPAGR